MREAVVSLDLEFNQPSGRIIQIGAVLGRVSTGEVISLFETKVNPGEPLSDMIAALTGIDADELDAAPDIFTAGRNLAIWLRQWDSVRQLNPLTWGGGDTQVLRTELGVNDERWLFGRRWIDVKTLYGAWRTAQGKEGAGALAKSMERLGMTFVGRPHNALHDSLNTFTTFRALLAEFRESGFIHGAVRPSAT
ncbi:MAG TPA: 3'-5' exonuclease [Steroidobacteraceae bacterium]|jgi:inhibitor of KinA sporulation pathway (predicted exonuclease)